MKNPEHNVYVGIKFFKSLLNQFHGDAKKALTAYNAGASVLAVGAEIPNSTLHYRKDILDKFKSS